jgi:MinD-like ATPase involved in chromosome partitioning or flagellar assembly
MNKLKKLGKGLEDISYLFLSSEQDEAPKKETMVEKTLKASQPILMPTKNICLVGNSQDLRDAFLVINLALALARLGMKIAVIDMDEDLPCLNFILGNKLKDRSATDKHGFIHQGPLGIKLAGLNESLMNRMSIDDDFKNLIREQLKSLETSVDLVLISVGQKSLTFMNPLLGKSIEEFLILVSPVKECMLDAYKVIKAIYSSNPVAKVGTIITDIEHMYEIDAVFNKMFSAVKKFLVKELYKYGFLFKLKQEVDSNTNIASFYDADLTACISNIAQIVILRLNLEENVSPSGELFENVLSEFGIK